MLPASNFTEQEYSDLLAPIWEYLAISQDPEPSDVIFVFGGLDRAVPARAAELYLNGFAQTVLVTGSFGPFSKDVFDKSEAEVFTDIMVAKGVPKNSIILETKAKNTLENVLFGMRALREHSEIVNSAILVAKSFLMRRCLATFRKQEPKLHVLSCPPLGEMSEFRDRDYSDFARRLVAEVDRIIKYGKSGDISEEATIPPELGAAIKRIQERFPG